MNFARLNSRLGRITRNSEVIPRASYAA